MRYFKTFEIHWGYQLFRRSVGACLKKTFTYSDSNYCPFQHEKKASKIYKKLSDISTNINHHHTIFQRKRLNRTHKKNANFETIFDYISGLNWARELKFWKSRFLTNSKRPLKSNSKLDKKTDSLCLPGCSLSTCYISISRFHWEKHIDFL